MHNSPLGDAWRLGGGATASVLHPLVLLALVIAGVLIVVLPRRFVMIPFLAAVLLIPVGQQLYVAGVHVYVPRLLVLVGWIRVALVKRSGHLSVASGGLNLVDKAFLVGTLYHAVATYLEYVDTQALINQAGYLWDRLGGYFLCRFLIRNDDESQRTAKVLAAVAIVLAVTMSVEKLTGINVFGFVGGRLDPLVRDGMTRANGSFVGPIPAGTFGATFVCVFVWLWRSARTRVLGVTGVLAAFVMVWTSGSSTPLLTLAAGILALIMWPMRMSMRYVRWGIVGCLVVLQVFMSAPFWFLINHISLVGGNSSFHRAMLVDAFIRHFSEWWLIGVRTTAEWGWDLWDQSNQFVSEGATGGLVAVVSFILVITACFKRLGVARRRARGTKREWQFWCLGCALFAFVVSFFGISFSDQSVYGWYALLSIICAATASSSAVHPAPVRQEATRCAGACHPVGIEIEDVERV